MRISDLKEADFRKYFEARLQHHRMRRSGSGFSAQCPLHEDQTPSLSINTEKGVWKCHGGCGHGGILDFEVLYSRCDKPTALANIAEITGQSQLELASLATQDIIYSYVDANGAELFQVVRKPGKQFSQRRKGPDGNWIYETSSIPMVLYHLDEVIGANEVCICEGEKDADRMRAEMRAHYKKKGWPETRVAATTSPRGAGKWQESFAPYFIGKKTLIFQDNDEVNKNGIRPGEQHALQVAKSIYPFANGVRIVSCPGVKDVSDYLDSGKTIEDIVALAKQTATWKPEKAATTLFMTSTQFVEKAAEQIDWVVEGLIQRGANGLFLGRPKAGKSPCALDLAIAMASKQKWLDFFIPQRTRVAFVSREDNAALTQWRFKKFLIHRELDAKDLDEWLYINAKGLRPKIMLDYPDDVNRLIADLKEYKSEVLFLDVMRVMHGIDENDNTLMQRVIDELNRIQDTAGCSICLLHHTNKDREATLTESARGAGAIAGWAEYVLGVRVEDEDTWVRQFKCEIKAHQAPDSFFWKIIDTPENGVKIERITYEPSSRGRRRTNTNECEPMF